MLSLQIMLIYEVIIVSNIVFHVLSLRAFVEAVFWD